MPRPALEEAHQALDELRPQLDRHGIELPDLAVDLTAAVTGVAAIAYGNGTAEGARRLAAALAQAPTP